MWAMLACASTLLASATTFSPNPTPNGLMVDFKHSPSLGVRTSKPEFTWIVPPCTAGGADHVQVAYSINVTTTASTSGKEELVWASGKVDSSASVGVVYGGPDLEPGTPYQWTVTTWTQSSSQVTMAPTSTSNSSPSNNNGVSSCQSDASTPGEFVTSLGTPGFDNSTLFLSTPDAKATFGYFRKEIVVPATMVSAQAFITAQGDDKLFSYYKFYINGNIVDAGPGRGQAPVFGGDGTFHALPYTTLDLTSIIANSVGKKVALSIVGMHQSPYVILQMQFRLADGSMQLTGSTDATWRAFNGDAHRNPGPAQHGGSAGTKFIEYIDARKEPVGWQLVGYDDSGGGWATAKATPPTASDVANLYSKMEPPIQVCIMSRSCAVVVVGLLLVVVGLLSSSADIRTTVAFQLCFFWCGLCAILGS